MVVDGQRYGARVIRDRLKLLVLTARYRLGLWLIGVPTREEAPVVEDELPEPNGEPTIDLGSVGLGETASQIVTRGITPLSREQEESEPLLVGSLQARIAEESRRIR